MARTEKKMSVTPHCSVWSVSSSIPPDSGTTDTSAYHQCAIPVPEREQELWAKSAPVPPQLC